MAYRNGPLSSEFSDYLNEMPRAHKSLKEKNALQRKKRQMVPEPLYRHTEQESGGIRNRWSHENEAMTNSKNDEEYRGNVGEHAVRSAQRDASEYKKRWDENQREQELHKQNQQKLADQKVQGRVVSQARRNLSDNISSNITPALSRARYISENGLDREDAALSRKELNRNIGVTETRNLVKSKGKPIVNYAIQEAERRTKQRNKK